LREIVCLDAITHAAGFVAPSMGRLGGATLMMARPDLARMINLIAGRHVSLRYLLVGAARRRDQPIDAAAVRPV
jgi:hypothetical protein